MIIALAGLPGCGKDTVAKILAEGAGFQVAGFSDSLKRVVAQLFDMDYDMLQAREDWQRKIRSTIDPRYGKTPVKILEEVGLKMREVHSTVFTKSALNHIPHGQDTIITDLRYPNEIDAVRSHGGVVWKIERGEDPDWVKQVKMYDIQSYSNMDPKASCLFDHDSQEYIHEAQWRMQCNNVKFDQIISNDGTLEDLSDFILMLNESELYLSQ